MESEVRKVGTSPELEADSWAFALALYARPGVAKACLALQNELDVDVMLLLMVTFAAVRHRILLTPGEIRALDATCGPWREQVVRKLRAIRTHLKTGPASAPARTTEQFRAQVKALELEAEKIQNQLLAERLPLRPGQEKVRHEQLRAILNEVAKRGGRPGTNLGASLSSSIAAIVEAAMQDAS